MHVVLLENGNGFLGIHSREGVLSHRFNQTNSSKLPKYKQLVHKLRSVSSEISFGLDTHDRVL